MGNNEEGKSSKSDKSSSPVPTNNIHVYPDWAAMQAYYGPHVNMPPYYSSAVASGHAPPPYMWGPTQPMMPSYGAPYAAIYSHGGVYAHPAVPLASHSLGVPSSPAAAGPVETPTKSPGNTEQGLMKKLKGFDGLAISIGNGTAENAEGRAKPRPSHSVETAGSADGSDGNTTGTDQSRRKRSREGTPTIGMTPFFTGEDEKIEAKSNQVAAGEVTATISPKLIGTVVSPGMTTGTILELRNTPTMNAMSSAMGVHCGVMPTEVWLQSERELKRERRKQSNRESARRSRLRKQAETEELARKVESLTSENAALRSEINQLTEMSEKVRLENAILVEELKNAQLGHAQENILNKKEDKEGEMGEKRSDSGAKLHQLLDPSPRDDAVAAG
ncbi:G-box-binding factor 3 isoform X2 [Gossypium hirsutum]|uniref:G-box-binding factor 3-like isoform X2 n=1 Tax=Gossypium hirsutum TaxID=3635 RepID=A0A1U8LBE5_GOSHI|nr:G-box-binding factor 3 isoform X2 [Gossypium hirsutum]XP_016710465.1 G-box-binding factor 3 isoform X2 [Gossypium hirsutum]